MAGSATTEQVWSELSSDLRRFIRRRVSREDVADDLLQETFVRIHRHLGALNDIDRLAAWVYQIARNVIRDHFRQEQDSAVSLENVDPPEATEDDPSCACRPAFGWMNELIEQLPDTYRDAVRYAEIDGLSQQDVAEQMGLTLSAAKSRIQRGRALLKGVLDQCCTFEFDRRGNLTDVDPRTNRTVCLDCDG